MSALISFDGIPGSGHGSRRFEVLRAIETIVDPCSRGLGRPVGLVSMGMIAELSDHDGRVTVEVLPTFPTCMFRGVLEEDIQARVGALCWVRSVVVCFSSADKVWDESRLSEDARVKLGRSKGRSAP